MKRLGVAVGVKLPAVDSGAASLLQLDQSDAAW